MDKYLSIITNFGCHWSCPYCIYKNGNLDVPKTTIDGLRELKRAIKENKVNWVSLSGGGDPLHHFHEHYAWYKKMFSKIPNDVRLEMHTSYTQIHDNIPLLYIFDRMVYHVRSISAMKHIVRYGAKQIVRVVFVVTNDFTPEKIYMIAKEVKSNPNIDELSFRQMVDGNFQPTHFCEEYLKAGHKKDWYYIEQGDYNLYYCENRVSTRYEDFKRNDG